MPSTIIPPGFAHVFLRWTVAGDNEEMLSSIGVRLRAGVSDPSLVAANLLTDWTANWTASSLGSQWVLVGARAYIGSDGDYPVGEFLLNQAGTGGLANLPNNCALLTQKRTALGGRRNRGRMFIPSGYTAESVVSETGVITAGNLATWQTRMTDFLADINANPTAYDAAVILHSSAPALPTVITSLTVSNRIATQRKRMRR